MDTAIVTSTAAIWLGVIAGIQLLLLTLVQGFIISRKERRDADIRSKEKAEDYARQDLVAARVATAAQQAADTAQLLLRAQKETIARTDEVARLRMESDKYITDKLDEGIVQGKKIHILVNSDMTAARTAERDAIRLLVVALKQVRASNVKLGIPPMKEMNDEIEHAENRITELDQILADRLAAQQRVDAEAAASTAKTSPT